MKERDNLLSLFNNRINQDIPDENILYENIDVDPDDEFKENKLYFALYLHKIRVRQK